MITFQEAKERKTQEQQTVFDAINEYKKTGSETTLNFIIETLRPYTGAVALSMLRSYKKSKSITTDAEEMAWDVSSIVLVKLWKHLKDFRNKYPASIYAWIGITVEHTIIDEVRKTSSELLQFSSDDYDADDNHLLDKQFLKGQGSPIDVPDNPENMQVTQEMRKVIFGLLDELPTKDAQILRFKYMHHMKNTDIAEEMGVSLSTVAHRSKNAEQKLLFIAESYQKKTGTKLYSIAIFELLGVLYYMSAQETTVPESAYAQFNQMLAEQTSVEATKATGKEIVKHAVKKATDTVTKKIIIGVVTTTLVAGTAFSILQKPDNDTPSDAPMEEHTVVPITFDEPLLDLDDKTQARLSVIIDCYWKNRHTTSPLIMEYIHNYNLSNEHYIQMLKGLIVNEHILGHKTENNIKMTHQELSDFAQHTLCYERNDEPIEWDQFFSKDKDGKYIIIANNSISYEQNWTFTSIKESSYGALRLYGYTYVDNECVEVEALMVKDSASALNGYRISSVSFHGEYADKDDIIDILKPEHIEDLTCMGQMFWSMLSISQGEIDAPLYEYVPIILKKLVIDNVLQKKILIDSQNQEYVLVSESELRDFVYNMILQEPNSEEIDDCFEKNSNGEYIVKKSAYSEFKKSAPENITLTHAYRCTDSPYAFVFTKPGNTGGTLIILAEHTPQSYVIGCNFYREVYTPNNFMNEDELIDYINQTKATYDELYNETYIEE